MEIQAMESSLNLMREKYKQADFYTREGLKKNAQIIKDKIKKQRTQYKILCKQKLDGFGKSVVGAIF